MDEWDDAWNETVKRAVVASAYEIHRYKGTPWAVRTALKNLGFQSVRIIENWDLENAGSYTFDVELYPLQEEQIPKVRRNIAEYKSLRSHLRKLSLRRDFAESPSTEDRYVEQLGTVLAERFPWPELYYGGTLFYGVPDDPGCAQYGVYKSSETLINGICNCFDERVWAAHTYGEEGLYYDWTAKYDVNILEKELLLAEPSPMFSESVEAAEGPLFTLQVYI